MDTVELANISTWVVRSLFFMGMLPQIYLNHKLRSTKGMSDPMLWGYFNGYLMSTFYVFCLDLPPAYKIMVPLSLLASFFLVIQRFSYDQGRSRPYRYYAVSITFAVLGLMLAFVRPAFVGHIAGWIAVIIWTLYQFPQIAKIYHEKSVVGYSFLLVTALGVGNIMELMTSYLLDLPDQSLVSSFRGILVYVIFIGEFVLYRRSRRKSD